MNESILALNGNSHWRLWPAPQNAHKISG